MLVAFLGVELVRSAFADETYSAQDYAKFVSNAFGWSATSSGVAASVPVAVLLFVVALIWKPGRSPFGAFIFLSLAFYSLFQLSSTP